MPKIRKPKLPQLLDRKISKTGQTRGADDDVIYQNRVKRNSTVLIPYPIWISNVELQEIASDFENGYIVLISPNDYFILENPEEILSEKGLELGNNCLVFYETRQEWNEHNPETLGWHYANNRTNPLGGNYVARVPSTTALRDSKINLGFHEQSPKGAGIRLYEYASSDTINYSKMQLEAFFGLCYDSIDVVVNFGMELEQALLRRKLCFEECESNGLLDYDSLYDQRIINREHQTVCPLCLKRLSGNGYFNRLAQAEGREVPDLTVTEINLFHINELRYGAFNHKPYNLGWGCHHCNVVVKDSGIYPTLVHMKKIIEDNIQAGYNI